MMKQGSPTRALGSTTTPPPPVALPGDSGHLPAADAHGQKRRRRAAPDAARRITYRRSSRGCTPLRRVSIPYRDQEHSRRHLQLRGGLYAPLPPGISYRLTACTNARRFTYFCKKHAVHHLPGVHTCACSDSACNNKLCRAKFSYKRASSPITGFASLPRSGLAHFTFTLSPDLRGEVTHDCVKALSTRTVKLAERVVREQARLAPYVRPDGAVVSGDKIKRDDTVFFYSVFHPAGDKERRAWKPHWNVFVSLQVRRGARYFAIDPGSLPRAGGKRSSEGYVDDYQWHWRDAVASALGLEDALPELNPPHLSVSSAEARLWVLKRECRTFPGWRSVGEKGERALARLQPGGGFASRRWSSIQRGDEAARAESLTAEGEERLEEELRLARAIVAGAESRELDAQREAERAETAARKAATEALESDDPDLNRAAEEARCRADEAARAAANAADEVATARRAAETGAGLLAPPPPRAADFHRCPECGAGRVHIDQLDREQAKAVLAAPETEDTALTPGERELLAQDRQGWGYLPVSMSAEPTLRGISKLAASRRGRQALLLDAGYRFSALDGWGTATSGPTVKYRDEVSNLCVPGFGGTYADTRDALDRMKEIFKAVDPSGEAWEELGWRSSLGRRRGDPDEDDEDDEGCELDEGCEFDEYPHAA